MSEINSTAVVVGERSFDAGDSTRSVSLRIKPDRRRGQIPFPREHERRAFRLAPDRLPEVGVLTGASRSRPPD
jgi:hypothetical protein